MSDTPETDEAQFGTGRVSVDFARRLERQRNETSHNLASIVAAILKRDGRDVFDISATDRLAELHAAERQRDEAINNYETAVLREHRMQEQRDEALSDLEFRRELYKVQEVYLEKAREERDELRETAERYRLEANAMMMQRDEVREIASKYEDRYFDMKAQRDELVEAVREAWLVMDDVEGMDKLDHWQNKCAKYIEGTLI
jgi:hypothetical protein